MIKEPTIFKKTMIASLVFTGLFVTLNLHLQELLRKVRDNDIDVVKALIVVGADVNYQKDDMMGYTPLFWAVTSADEKLVGFLVKNGANVNASAVEGKIPLSVATEAGNINIIDVLKAAGAK